MKKIRIFVSSPSDVAPERARVDRVIKSIETEYASGIDVEVIRWEENYYSASSTFQDQISQPAEADIVICILWKRLGSELPEFYNRSDGSTRTGTEFEFENALEAALGSQMPDILLYRKKEKILFDADRVDQEKAELQALESFWRRWVQNEKGHFTAGFKFFNSTDDFEQILVKDLKTWFRNHLHTVTWPESKGAPYRGLDMFEEEHYPIYFGRRRAISETRARLIANAERDNIGFLLIIGASGAGKSSLVRAGLIPALKEHHPVPGIDAWRQLIIRPSDLGLEWQRHFSQLLSQGDVLPEILEGDYSRPGEIAALWEKDTLLGSVPVKSAIKRWGRAVSDREGRENAAETRLVVVIDQLEELFQWPEKEQLSFLSLIDAFVRSGVIWVVATMRSDFYPQLFGSAQLMALKEDMRQYDLATPDLLELHEIITGPAKAAGLSFENTQDGMSMADVLQKEAETSPESLPLLEFTLTQLYEERDREKNRLTLDAYERLGGLKGALTKTAEAVFNDCSSRFKEDPDRVFTQVMRELIAIDEHGKATRRVARLSRFQDHPDELLFVNQLIEMRLLRSYIDNRLDGQAVVDITHEALISNWQRLDSWLKNDRELLQVRDRVQGEEQRWSSENKNKGLLSTSGKRLEDLLYLDSSELHLEPELRQYVDASKKRVRTLKRRKRILISFIMLVSFLAAGFGTLTLNSMRKLYSAVGTIYEKGQEFNDLTEKSTKQVSKSQFLYGNTLVNTGQYKKAVFAYVRAMNQATSDNDDLRQPNEWISKVLPSIRLSELILQNTRTISTGKEIQVISDPESNLVALIEDIPENNENGKVKPAVTRVKVVNLADNRIILKTTIPSIEESMFSPSGRYLAVETENRSNGSEEHQIKLFDLADPQKLPLILSGLKFGHEVEFDFLNDQQVLVRQYKNRYSSQDTGTLKSWLTSRNRSYTELDTLIEDVAAFDVLNDKTLLINLSRLWRLEKGGWQQVNELDRPDEDDYSTRQIVKNDDFAYLLKDRENNSFLAEYYELRLLINPVRKIHPEIDKVDLNSSSLESIRLDPSKLIAELENADAILPYGGLFSESGDRVSLFFEYFNFDSTNFLVRDKRRHMAYAYDTATDDALGTGVSLEHPLMAQSVYSPVGMVDEYMILRGLNKRTVLFLPGGEIPRVYEIPCNSVQTAKDFFLLANNDSTAVISKNIFRKIIREITAGTNLQALYYVEDEPESPVPPGLPLTRQEYTRTDPKPTPPKITRHKRKRKKQSPAVGKAAETASDRPENRGEQDMAMPTPGIIRQIEFFEDRQVSVHAVKDRIVISGRYDAEFDCGGKVQQFFLSSKELMSVSTDGEIRIWDWELYRLIFQASLSSNVLDCMIDSRKIIVSTDNREICHVHKTENEWRLTKSETKDHAYILAGQGNHLISGGKPGHIDIYEWNLDFKKRVLIPDKSAVTHMTLSDTAGIMAIGTGNGLIHLFDTANFGHDRTFNAGSSIHRLLLTSDGKYLVAVTRNGTIHSWDLGRNIKTINNLALGRPAVGVRISDDQQWLVLTGLDNYVRIYDIAAGREVLSKSFGQSVTLADVRLSSDNWYLAVTNHLGETQTIEVGNQLFGKKEADLFRLLASSVLFRADIIASQPEKAGQILDYYTQPDPKDKSFWTLWAGQVLGRASIKKDLSGGTHQ